MKNTINKYFKEAIRLNMTLDGELKNAILNHERTNKYLDNMSEQLSIAQRQLIKKGRVVDLKTMKSVVYDMTDVFVASIKMEAKERHESVIDKLARQAEAQKKADMDATIAGKPAGDYEDLIEPSEDSNGREESKA